MVDSLGFMQCKVEQAVFFNQEMSSDLTIMVVHVNNCIIAGLTLVLVADVKR